MKKTIQTQVLKKRGHDFIQLTFGKNASTTSISS